LILFVIGKKLFFFFSFICCDHLIKQKQLHYSYSTCLGQIKFCGENHKLGISELQVPFEEFDAVRDNIHSKISTPKK